MIAIQVASGQPTEKRSTQYPRIIYYQYLTEKMSQCGLPTPSLPARPTP